MPEIRTTHLFDMSLQVSGMQPIGATPNGNRRIGLVAGGTFAGERLRGTVLPGGADWIIARPDGVTTLDVRLVLQTDDGAAIGMVYRGLRHGPAESCSVSTAARPVDPARVLFPHRDHVRDRGGTIRLAQSHLRDRHRTAARPRDRSTRFTKCSEPDRRQESRMPGPLAGVRVIEVAIAVLGPLAGQMLGDMGAEIIKVETPDGDPMRQIGPARNPGMAAYFLTVNRNKKSLVLDLKRKAAREAMLRLAATADVFVHNMRTGAAARLGIDYKTIAAVNPHIVYASATGYRPGTRYEDRAAFDDVIQGESGFAALNGGADGPPRYVPMVVCDKVSGHVLAGAVAMALFARERSGKGQEIHVPMMETMAAFNLVDHFWHGVFGEPEKGLGYPRMLTPYRRPYATADGHICLLATTDRQWRGLFAAMDCPELGRGPALFDNCRAHRKYRRAVYDCCRAHAAAHDRGNGARVSTNSTCRTGSSTISPDSSPTRI